MLSLQSEVAGQKEGNAFRRLDAFNTYMPKLVFSRRNLAELL